MCVIKGKASIEIGGAKSAGADYADLYCDAVELGNKMNRQYNKIQWS